MTGRAKPDSNSQSPANRKAKVAFSLISRDKLVSIYTAMVRCALLDERLRLLSASSGPSRQAGLVPCSPASLAGAAIDLRRGDAAICTHNNLYVDLVRGTAPVKALRTLKPAQPRLRPATAIEDGLRLAAAASVEKKGDVAMLFVDYSSASLPEYEFALKAAAECSLPLIVVALDADGALSSTSKRHTPHRTRAHGVPRFVVDAGDAVAVYRVAFEAMARARLGRGPTSIECASLAPHPKRGLPPEPAADAIAGMERYLDRKGFFTNAMRKRIAAQFHKELDGAATKLLKWQSNGRMVE